MFCFALFSSVFDGERRFQSSAHPREKEPSCISKGRGTPHGTKQDLKIVTRDSAEGGAGQCPGSLQALLQKLQFRNLWLMC